MERISPGSGGASTDQTGADLALWTKYPALLGRRFALTCVVGVLLAAPHIAAVRGARAAGISHKALALYHAPIHYQDTDSTQFRADFITRLKFDGTWATDDNWDNLDHFTLPAYAYASVVETCTHWLIVYSFFHPRDWAEADDLAATQQHENDMEGLLAVVRKDAAFGVLEAVVAVFHKDFFAYTPLGSPLVSGGVQVQPTPLEMRFHNGSLHPVTAQEAKGHGLKAYPDTGDFHGAPGEDGIIYYPSTVAGMPTSGTNLFVEYRLLDMFSNGRIWKRQLDDAPLSRESAKAFAEWGTFKGNSSGGCNDTCVIMCWPGGCGCRPDTGCADDSANAPWGWDDHDDGPILRGEMALDPAHLVDYYFDYADGRTISRRYVRNRFIRDLKKRKYSNTQTPRGWPDGLDMQALFDKANGCCAPRYCWAPKPECPGPVSSDDYQKSTSIPAVVGRGVRCETDLDCTGNWAVLASAAPDDTCNELRSQHPGCVPDSGCRDATPAFRGIGGCACPATQPQVCLPDPSLMEHYGCRGSVCFPPSGPPYECG